jgi:hypothetical protein
MADVTKSLTRALVILVLAALYATPAAIAFIRQWEPEPIVTGPGVTRKTMLSEYFSGIRGTPVDTEVYIFEGEEPGGTMFIIGSNHPVEPAGLLTQVLLVENARVKQGRLIVIPRAMASGYTATEPGQGYPAGYEIKTDFGVRWFRYGMRNINPIHQFPDPDVFVNWSSGQKLAGAESGNLNRNFPGRPNGRPSEKLAYAIMELIRKEKADISIDLHESPPCRPAVNSITAHQRGLDIGAYATMLLEDDDIRIRIEVSPPNLRGLSHREWGDHSDTLAFLLESCNPMHGPLHGPATVDLLLTAKDEVYEWASDLGRTVIRHPSTGVPIAERVGRHVATIMALATAWSDMNPDRAIVIEGMPTYEDLLKNGVGRYLLPVPGS